MSGFDALSIKCAASDTVCARYATDEGVRTAWEHMLDRFVGHQLHRNQLAAPAPSFRLPGCSP